MSSVENTPIRLCTCCTYLENEAELSNITRGESLLAV